MVETPSPQAAPASTFAAPLSPEVEWYLEQRGYVVPDGVAPLWRTAEPRDEPGAIFDPERVDRAVAALKGLRHTQGKWAGRPLAPDAWQVAYFIAPVFGWIHANSDGAWVRIIRSAWIEVPRKNGKTTIASGCGLYLAFGDGEPGAQVFAAAGSRDQAMNAYRPAKLIAEKSPAFRDAGIRAFNKEIVRPEDQSFMKAVASVGDLLQGTNPNGYIVDELHVHKSPDVIDALESGVGARDQPLGLIITTADAGDELTVYAQRRKRAEQLCSGVLVDPTEYVVIFAARKDADPYAETTWQGANPGYPTSPTREFMQAEANKAKGSPANLARFLRLNLNVRTKQETRFIDLDAWDRNAGVIDLDVLAGRRCYAGLDLASVSDLSAMCLLFADGDGGFDALWRFWTPEDNLRELDRRTTNNASLWVEQGWLTVTPGNVQDYDFIEAAATADADAYEIVSFGFDPYGATQLVNNLQGAGLPMVKVRQGFLTLSPAMKELQRMILKGSAEGAAPMLRHGGNPVMRWMTDNLAVEVDAAGNVKPSKKRGMTTGNKIDGWSAMATAISEAIADDALNASDPTFSAA